MAAPLRLALLGGLHASLDRAPLTGFVSSKAQALLCYLAVTGRPHARASLAGLLWGDMPEAAALTSLRKALSNLNQLVGSHLAITRHDVGLNHGSPFWSDVNEFQACLQRGEVGPAAAALRQAVALYQRDFLEGFYVRGAPSFEAWMLAERARLKDLALQALYRLAAHHAARREFVEGIEYTRRLLALEPWREEAHRQLMLLLARSGQRSAALKQYETCRRLLADELSVEPMAETTRLYERLRASGATPPHNLPPQPTPFVGREAELTQIARLLGQRTCRLVTLVGLGGIGKTRVALEAAEAALPLFLDGVFFVSLAALDSPAYIPAAIAEAVRLPLHGRADPREQLCRYLRDRETLIVLDNFEHLLPGAALLANILAAAPDVKLLATSRERLNLHAEWVFELGGMRFPRQGLPRAEDLKDFGAVRLFSQSAARARGGALAEADMVHVVHICRMVEGMPLGIELAAAWARSHSPAGIAQEIDHSRSFLATAQPDVPARHRSLRAVFDHSWDLLSSAERQAFRQLSVFRGGFTPEAAQAVAAAAPPVLEALVAKSLVRRSPAGRCDLHELVRQYAVDHLAGEDRPVRDRHVDFYLRLAEQAAPGLYGAEQLTWLERLEAENDNLRAALEWSLASAREAVDPSAAVRLAIALGPFWLQHAYFEEGRMWLGRALAVPAPPASEPAARLRVVALYLAGMLALHQSDYAHMTALAGEGLKLSEAHDDAWGRGISLSLLGCAAFNQGGYERAKELCGEGLALMSEPNSPQEKWIAAQAFTDLGDAELGQGHHRRAGEAWGRGLALYRELGDRRGMALALNNQGYVAYRQGDFERAVAAFEEALALFRAVRDKTGMGNAIRLIGLTAQAQGDYARASALFEESRQLCQDIGDRLGVVYSLWYLGRLALAEGDLQRAQKLCAESLALAREVGSQPLVAWTLHSLGSAACALRDYERARDLLAESLAVARAIGDHDGIADALTGFACLAAARGQPERAVQLFGAAAARHAAQGSSVAPSVRAEHDRSLAAARGQLTETSAASALSAGQALTLEQAVALVEAL